LLHLLLILAHLGHLILEILLALQK
jgi:hypothetical protein